MDLLIDTHVFLWWEQGGGSLGSKAAAVIADPSNRVHVSAATIWEIAIKARKGKLTINGPLLTAVDRAGFLTCPILPEHGEAAGFLDWEHEDPFDRLLVAQALSEKLVLVHADRAIAGYGAVGQIWAR